MFYIRNKPFLPNSDRRATKHAIRFLKTYRRRKSFNVDKFLHCASVCHQTDFDTIWCFRTDMRFRVFDTHNDIRYICRSESTRQSRSGW